MPDVPPTHLEIKDWSRHQHYRDRRPPWIKLYGALLDDATFLALPEVAQAQLIKLWLLASRMGHPLPNDAKLLAGKIGTRKLALQALLASGFVVPCYQNASDPLAEPLQDARPLSTENRERELQEPSSPRAELLGLVPNRAAWEGEMRMCADGARGAPYKANAEQMETACRDYLGNGASSSPNLAQFRAYIRRAVTGEDVKPAGRRGGTGQRSYDNTLEALRDL